MRIWWRPSGGARTWSGCASSVGAIARRASQRSKTTARLVLIDGDHAFRFRSRLVLNGGRAVGRVGRTRDGEKKTTCSAHTGAVSTSSSERRHTRCVRFATPSRRGNVGLPEKDHDGTVLTLGRRGNELNTGARAFAVSHRSGACAGPGIPATDGGCGCLGPTRLVTRSVAPDRPPASIVPGQAGAGAELPSRLRSPASAAAMRGGAPSFIVMELLQPRPAGEILPELLRFPFTTSPIPTRQVHKLNAGIRVRPADDVIPQSPTTTVECLPRGGSTDGSVRFFANPVVRRWRSDFGSVSRRAPGGSRAGAYGGAGTSRAVETTRMVVGWQVRRVCVVDVGGFDETGSGAGTPDAGGEEGWTLVLTVFAARGWTCDLANAAAVSHLEARDPEETSRTLFGSGRGAGDTLAPGPAAECPMETFKGARPRFLHELGYWRDPGGTRGPPVGTTVCPAPSSPPVCCAAPRSRRSAFSDETRSTNAGRQTPAVLWVYPTRHTDRHQGGGQNIRQADAVEVYRSRADVTLLLARSPW